MLKKSLLHAYSKKKQKKNYQNKTEHFQLHSQYLIKLNRSEKKINPTHKYTTLTHTHKTKTSNNCNPNLTHSTLPQQVQQLQ